MGIYDHLFFIAKVSNQIIDFVEDSMTMANEREAIPHASSNQGVNHIGMSEEFIDESGGIVGNRKSQKAKKKKQAKDTRRAAKLEDYDFSTEFS